MPRTATAFAILLARAAVRARWSTAAPGGAAAASSARAAPRAFLAADAGRRRRQAATTTVGGAVYEDLEANGTRDADDPPVGGVGVTLFSCDTGSAVSEAVTADDGTYALAVPSSSPAEDPAAAAAAEEEACYYVQFEAGGSYAFTAPANGETSDIYVAAGGGGEAVADVDAGIAFATTYSPTVPGGTPGPTVDYGSPPTATTGATTGAPGPAPSAVPAAPASDAPAPDAPPSIPPASIAPASAAPAPIAPASAAPASIAPASTAPIDEGGGGDDPESRGQQEQQQPPPPDVLDLESTVLVRLYDASSPMDDDSASAYESACGSFLGHQLSIATPPVYDLECVVVGQEVGTSPSRRGRRRRAGRRGRGLAEDEADETANEAAPLPSMDVETRVTGRANATSTVRKPSDVKFADLLVGTFNVQGYLFLEELQAEEGAGTKSGYFDDVGEVRGSHTEDVPIASTDDAPRLVDAVVTQLSHVHIGVIAAACAIVSLLLCCCICRVKTRRKDADAGGRDEEIFPIRMRGGKSGKFDASAATTGSGRGRSKDLPPIATTWTALDGVETGLQEVVTAASSFSSSSSPHPPDGGSGPILRDVVAPPGKLGIVVANAFRPNANNAMRYGPAVFALKDGSPMLGLIHEKDVIVSINDVDTTDFTVEELTQMMMDTASGRRKITVLSSHH
jgi:hypothetical protein